MRFLKRRIDRVVDLEETQRRHAEEEKLPLEKGDLTAMFIAAVIVIGPVLLLLAGLLLALGWLFGAYN